MSEQNPAVKRGVLVVSWDWSPFADVTRAVAYLGGAVSVEIATSLGAGASLTGRPFDAVVIATTARMRLKHYGTLVSLVRAFSGKKSTVFVIGPLDDRQFVAEMTAAGARNVIDTDYDMAILRQVFLSVLPAATCDG